MNNIIGFMCTGPDTGFDPICDSTDAWILLAVIVGIIFAIFAALGFAVHGYRKSRGATSSLIETSVLAFLGTCGFLALLFLLFGISA